MNVKYKVGEREGITGIPNGALILNAKIVFVDEDGDRALVYLPKRTKYKFEGTTTIDDGDDGSLIFGIYDNKHRYWVGVGKEFLNIALKQYER